MTKLKMIILTLAAVVTGMILGGYLFANTRPRSFLALNNCEGTCFQANELLGLLTSVGIQRFPAVIPKRDIKNIAELSDSDNEYLLDVFKVVREIVKEKNLTDYRLTTNGPGYQGVTYLHFHLTAN